MNSNLPNFKLDSSFQSHLLDSSLLRQAMSSKPKPTGKKSDQAALMQDQFYEGCGESHMHAFTKNALIEGGGGVGGKKGKGTGKMGGRESAGSQRRKGKESVNGNYNKTVKMPAQLLGSMIPPKSAYQNNEQPT